MNHATLQRPQKLRIFGAAEMLALIQAIAKLHHLKQIRGLGVRTFTIVHYVFRCKFGATLAPHDMVSIFVLCCALHRSTDGVSIGVCTSVVDCKPQQQEPGSSNNNQADAT